jgi:hypothetical protein
VSVGRRGAAAVHNAELLGEQQRGGAGAGATAPVSAAAETTCLDVSLQPVESTYSCSTMVGSLECSCPAASHAPRGPTHQPSGDHPGAVDRGHC